MANLNQVVKAMDTVARNAAGSVIKRLPSPEDCGCGRRKRKLLKSLKTGKSAGEIVREQLEDIRGK